MSIRSVTHSVAALAVLVPLAVAPLRAEDDPKEILRRALRIDARNRELERSYTYVQRDEERTLDGAGKVKRRESRTWDVTPLKGSQFRRLIERDDRPLSPKEEQEQEGARQRREAARQKTAGRLANETPAERRKRQERQELARKRRQAEMDEVVEGFDLRLAGEEQIDGEPVWVIAGDPRKGYRFQDGEMARFLSRVKGRIWIAKADYQPVRIDAETTDTISFGGVVARIYKGSHIHIEYTHVNGEVWLPKVERFGASGRILMVKGLRLEGESTYSNYRKFSADSRIVEDQ